MASKVYKAFLGREEAAFSNGALSKMNKELIAIEMGGGPATAHAQLL
ncbi:hypothetical protein [Magnetovibrio blakemorei]|nr:hypothetical protein [Magnetovibrio blakemorei]